MRWRCVAAKSASIPFSPSPSSSRRWPRVWSITWADASWKNNSRSEQFMEPKAIIDAETVAGAVITEVRRKEAVLKTGALQNAILNSANFSSIATDEKGVIQIFNVGAERMLGYAAADVVNKITPADISDPQELIARAEALSLELGTTITPGFQEIGRASCRERGE